ncbi:hypothetical protein H8356DRAFT_1737653 [Neocallimastix lanati (nom. inval.)]|nr:hypothetical protein H8356DRAFT_1737653 [Neocallimastix sp. JGI-2020a]
MNIGFISSNDMLFYCSESLSHSTFPIYYLFLTSFFHFIKFIFWTSSVVFMCSGIVFLRLLKFF